jgi:tripartite ATP-independent transporter DctM subunit
MDPETLETVLPLSMFAALFLLILTGFPVAFVLAGTGLAFGLLGAYLEIFYITDFGFIPSRIYGVMSNFTLIAVPLFIFMGMTLEKSGIAEELLITMEKLFRRFRGGLTLSIILVGALLAASTGIVGATVVTMGVLSLPTMLSRGYDSRLASGCIASSGTLGQIIPPSIVLVLLGDMMNIAVADLFAGAIIPGLLLVSFYLLYVVTRATLQPGLAPPLPADASSRCTVKEFFSSFAPPLALILLVLGSILAGAASPTESAGCGAFGALIIALLRKRLSLDILRQISARTTSVTAMVFTLLIGAQVFSVVFRGISGDDVITDFITGMDAGKETVLFAVMVLLFVLGFFLDFIEICFIVVPVISPLLVSEMGFDPLWLAILIAVNLQTSFLTPPFGFALFYLKGVAPPGVTTMDIYRGVLPFVLIQLFALSLLWCFPELVTWLPGVLFSD